MTSQPVTPVPSCAQSLPADAHNSTSSNPIQICIIATYFGPLPAYFQLWLRSCAANPRIQFLLISDQSPERYKLPANIRFERASLSDLREIFSAALGIPVELRKPYKICDFRPFYWILVNWFGIECSHWGHCDVDVIFGDLSKFLPPELLDRCDRLFELGHLSIYRNCPIVNSMCFSHFTGSRWKHVVTSEDHYGFDEHNGVNLAWEVVGLRWHRNKRICFDIEPSGAAIQTAKFGVNHHRQVIYWVNGRLFQAFLAVSGQARVHEIAYVHFQKRNLQPQFDQESATAFVLTGDTILEVPLDLSGSVNLPKLLAAARIPSVREKAIVALNAARNLKAEFQLRQRAASVYCVNAWVRKRTLNL